MAMNSLTNILRLQEEDIKALLEKSVVSQGTHKIQFTTHQNKNCLLEPLNTVANSRPIVPAEGLTVKQWLRVHHINSAWSCSLAWVLKHQLKLRTNDYPMFKGSKLRPYERWGDFLNSGLELSYGCLDFLDKQDLSNSLAYKDATEWWILWALEVKQNDLNSMFQEKVGKRNIEKLMKIQIEKLMKKENPFNPDNPYERHTYNLVAASIFIAKHHPKESNEIKANRKIFRDRYWKPFISAYRGWKSYIHEADNLKAVYQSDDGDFKITLTGRQEVSLFPL